MDLFNSQTKFTQYLIVFVLFLNNKQNVYKGYGNKITKNTSFRKKISLAVAFFCMWALLLSLCTFLKL